MYLCSLWTPLPVVTALAVSGVAGPLVGRGVGCADADADAESPDMSQ